MLFSKIFPFGALFFLLSIALLHSCSAQTPKVEPFIANDSLKMYRLNDSTLIMQVGDTVMLFEMKTRNRLQPLVTNQVVKPRIPQVIEIKPVPSPWTTKGTFSLNFSNVGLTNWVGGGNSAISLGGIGTFVAKRENAAGIWEHNFRIAYGVTRVGDFGFEKSDDALNYNTQYARKFAKRFSLSFRLDFATQLDAGFRIDNTTRERLEQISAFMAPGRVEISSGVQYGFADRDRGLNFSATLAPVTGKLTFVLSDVVDETRYGVEEGGTLFSELGSQFFSNLSIKVYENVNFQNTIRLFSNYERPGNIDVNWETVLVFKINRFLATNFSTNLIYDDDILVPIQDNEGNVIGRGPRVQFKHVLNVGINLIF